MQIGGNKDYLKSILLVNTRVKFSRRLLYSGEISNHEVFPEPAAVVFETPLRVHFNSFPFQSTPDMRDMSGEGFKGPSPLFLRGAVIL